VKRIGWLMVLCCVWGVAGAEEMTHDEGVFNYRELDASLSTSGQVSDEQVALLTEGAYGLVVNLAVADPERNANEGFLVTQAGISYTQIPVIWEAPTLEDLALFFAVMDARGDRRTLVHCFANYRASAFTYLYRTIRLGVPEAEARADMESIWSEEAWAEYPQWVAFIDEAKAHYGYE
jgi:protein tyrosine phosphatase (PTP) superfamily phosphohydrolase (DUF442 family)